MPGLNFTGPIYGYVLSLGESLAKYVLYIGLFILGIFKSSNIAHCFHKYLNEKCFSYNIYIYQLGNRHEAHICTIHRLSIGININSIVLK